MATLPLIQRAFASLPATVTTFAFRADTACYDDRTLQWLADPQGRRPRGPLGVPIGADMTQDLHAVCAAVADGRWQCFEDRPTRPSLPRGRVHAGHLDKGRPAPPLHRPADSEKQGQLFASERHQIPGAREQSLGRARRRSAPLALAEGGDDRARARHHQERARRRCAAVWALRANAAWYRLSLLTYNVLSALKSLALPPALSTARRSASASRSSPWRAG